MSELSVFVYIKSHLTLYVKSKAQKVNLIRLVHKLNNNRLSHLMSCLYNCTVRYAGIGYELCIKAISHPLIRSVSITLSSVVKRVKLIVFGQINVTTLHVVDGK